MGTLVRQARRRILGNELFRQGANSGSAALAAFILLLLFGTQILSWQFLLLIPVAAAVLGLYRVRKRLPAPYSVAQLIDQRLELADSLSTALFFDQVKPDAPVSADVRRAQFEEAGRVAEKVDVRQAIPYRMPRSAYAMAALMVVALGLFGLRYGISRQLDLRQPLANFLPESLTGSKPAHQANNTRRSPKQTPQTPDEGNGSPDQDQQSPGQQEANQETQTPGEAQSEASGKSEAKSLPGQKSGDQADDQMASDDQQSEGDGAEGKNGQEDQNGKQADGKNGQPDKQQSGSPKEGNTEGENSLMNKMKDAFQNLLSKVKPQQNQQGNQQPGNQEQSANKQDKQQQGSKQQQGKEGQPEKGGQQGDSQEGEDGQEAKNSENAQQGKGQGKSDSQQSTKQPGSGVGSQDGDKAIKNAEQLAAMGKISEILGKRAATVSGEATVEVQSTSQQLRTPYAQKGAEHSQSGAEISRDEVPVALQPYVQQYFEQLRKQAPPSAGPVTPIGNPPLNSPVKK